MARPSVALAHASLLRADPPDLCSPLVIPRVPAGDPRCAAGQVLPSPPTTVRLFFNERVSPVGRGVRVLGPDGRRVDHGPVRLDGSRMIVAIDAAEVGTYFVTWRVVSTDTHPARGAFAFSVGRASSPPGGGLAAGGAGITQAAASGMDLALQAMARAMHFAGYALGFGAFAFQVLVLHPLAPDARAAERRVWRLVGAGVVLLLAAEPLALLAQTSSLGAGALDSEVIGGALDSSFGRVLAQRLGAALLLWMLLGLRTVPGHGGRAATDPRGGRSGSIRADATVAILGVALAFIDGEAAHASGARPAWVGMGANTLHVAAMGAWVGGVAALLRVWWLPEMACSRREVAARTGRVAAAALGVLAVTGTVMAVQHLGGPLDVLTNGYGRTLGVKLGMVCAVLLAARGRWWGWEAGALAAVLALAGLLVSLPPPR